MTRVCTVCRHPERPLIEEALARGEPLRNIAMATYRWGTALYAVTGWTT